MGLTQDALGYLLIFLMIFLFLLIFFSIYYLWKKTEELEQKSASASVRAESPTTADILGLSGKDIWEFIVVGTEDTERLREVKRRFVFVLQRHLESILEQGFYDSKKGKVLIPTSEAKVGGLGGEIASWIPQNRVNEFYEIGQRLNFSGEDADVFRDIRLSLNESIASIVRELDLEIKVEAFVDRLIGNIEPLVNLPS